MNAGTSQRCPHYQIYSEPLGLEGSPSFLVIRRCLLTERLSDLLRNSVQGEHLAQKLTVRASNGRVYGIVGPDLEAVSQQSCTFSRCETRCTPAYSLNLEHFGLTDPQEDTVSCEDEDEDDDKEAARAGKIHASEPDNPSAFAYL